jgi:hypothetical protein
MNTQRSFESRGVANPHLKSHIDAERSIGPRSHRMPVVTGRFSRYNRGAGRTTAAEGQ